MKLLWLLIITIIKINFNRTLTNVEVKIEEIINDQ